MCKLMNALSIERVLGGSVFTALSLFVGLNPQSESTLATFDLEQTCFEITIAV